MNPQANQTAENINQTKPVLCKKCGSSEFFKRTVEERARVLVFRTRFGIEDELIREGDSSFDYECVKCTTLIDDSVFNGDMINNAGCHDQ